jgi:hypothetical protein
MNLVLSLSLGGVTLKRRCTYRPSVIYLIVNKPLSRARARARAFSLLPNNFSVREPAPV